MVKPFIIVGTPGCTRPLAAIARMAGVLAVTVDLPTAPETYTPDLSAMCLKFKIDKLEEVPELYEKPESSVIPPWRQSDWRHKHKRRI